MNWFNDRLLAWSTALGTLCLCVPLCIYAVAERVQAQDAIVQARSVGEDHESRLRLLEAKIDKITVDVDWIRKSLEKKEAVASN